MPKSRPINGARAWNKFGGFIVLTPQLQCWKQIADQLPYQTSVGAPAEEQFVVAFTAQTEQVFASDGAQFEEVAESAEFKGDSV